jgi:transposase-like protein
MEKMGALPCKKDRWICPHCKTEWHLMEGYEIMPDGTKVCKNPRCRRKITDEDVYR